MPTHEGCRPTVQEAPLSRQQSASQAFCFLALQCEQGEQSERKASDSDFKEFMGCGYGTSRHNEDP